MVGSILLAVGLFLTPDLDVRTDARYARAEFGRALGAYADLVALERLGCSGSRQAMELAAEVGGVMACVENGDWVLQHDDLADIMRLSKEGSQVYSNLRARSGALRSAMLNEELSKANATGERMSMPMSLLGVVFMAILVAPQLLRVMAGG